MPWGAAIAAVGGIASSAIAGGAAGTATGISQGAIDQASQLAQTNSATYQPFVDQGTAGATQLGNILGVNGSGAASTAMSSFTGSPGFAYAEQQGLRAVDNSAAGQGMGRSGATLKAEQTLGTNLADQNFNTYIGQLQGLSGLGLQGASGQAGTTSTFDGLLGGQTTNQVNTATGSGTALASILGNTASGIYQGAGGSSGIAKLFGTTPTAAGTPSNGNTYNPALGY